jgi:hypothetical protein
VGEDAVRLPLAVAMLLGLAAAAPGFDISECDGDASLGNAGILLGWAQPTATSIGTVRIDDQGAANSGVSPADANTDWAAALATWTAIGGTTLNFPATSSTTITSAALEATLGKGDGARAWMLVQPTTRLGSAAGQGWEAVTSTDACSFLGLTYTVFDLNTRLLVDADIMLNDDGPAPAADPDCPGGRAPFYSQAAGDSNVTGKFDLRGIMAHEIGHFLGSEHSIQAGALMEATALAGTDLALATDDQDMLRFLYPTAADPTPPDRNNLSLTACTSQGSVATTGSRSSGGCAAGYPQRAGGALSWLLLGGLLALRLLWRPKGRR